MAGPAGPASAGTSDFPLSDDIRRRRNYALVMLMLVYMSSHIDRGIVGILAEPIKKDLDLSDTQIGIMSGLAFAVLFATLGIPLAVLADRTNRRNIIVVALTTWNAMTIVCGFAQNYLQLLLARIGVGIGEADSSPQSHSMISDMYAPHERARALGFYSLGVTFGGMIGALVGGYVSVHWGWRTAFFVVGAPGVALAILVYLTVPEAPRLNRVARLPACDCRPDPDRFCGLWRQILRTCFFGADPWRSARPDRLDPRPDCRPCRRGGRFGGRLLRRQMGKKRLKMDRLGRRLGQDHRLPADPGILPRPRFPACDRMPFATKFFGAFYLGPAFAMVQSVSPPAMHVTTAAISLFILNLVALGLGPTSIGVASDVLKTQFNFGSDSLRYALAGASLLNLWAAAHFCWAGRAYADEVRGA